MEKREQYGINTVTFGIGMMRLPMPVYPWACALQPIAAILVLLLVLLIAIRAL